MRPFLQLNNPDLQAALEERFRAATALALETAKREKLTLRTSTSKTGYAYVLEAGRPGGAVRYNAQAKDDGVVYSLGSFLTPAEAALCCARHAAEKAKAVKAAKSCLKRPLDNSAKSGTTVCCFVHPQNLLATWSGEDDATEFCHIFDAFASRLCVREGLPAPCLSLVKWIACTFKSKLMAALETVEMSEEPWEEFHTAGNRKGQYDHLTKSQRSKGGKKGGKATIASHGEQLGNSGRKSSRLFP